MILQIELSYAASFPFWYALVEESERLMTKNNLIFVWHSASLRGAFIRVKSTFYAMVEHIIAHGFNVDSIA